MNKINKGTNQSFADICYSVASFVLIVMLALMPMFSGWANAIEDEIEEQVEQSVPCITESTFVDDESNSSVATEPDEVTETETVSEEESTETTEEPTVSSLETESECYDQTEVDATESQTTELEIETEVDITNENTADLENDVSSSGNSGVNQLTAGTDEEEGGEVNDSSIDTGVVNVYANVLNIVNTNLYNSEIVKITENFNNVSTDLLMNQPETTPRQLSQDLVSALCQDIECRSLTTFKLTNNNEAEIDNEVNVSGNSGINSINNAGSDNEIRTGNVNALVNILNIANANMVNSRWTIATFNVFGDWTGDLVLPSELYFDDYVTIGQTSGLNVSQMEKIILEVTNNNLAEVNNNVSTLANSGANTIEAEDDVEGNSLETGDSLAATNVKNVLNTTLINSDWFLSIVNTLGSWTGNVYSLPEQVDFEQTSLGMTFFSTSSSDPQMLQQFSDTMEVINSGQEVTIEIENNNNAVINNNVQVEANSGLNTVSGTQVGNTRILTGYTRALTNIFNFANTNLINSNLHVGLMNIFGAWTGNVVFGYPDLAVTQRLLQGNIPKDDKEQVNYEITYTNQSGSSMVGAKLVWEYNTDLLGFDLATHKPSRGNNGKLEFDLGRLAPNASGKIQIQLKTLKNQEEGNQVQSFARINGGGPEKNLLNNFNTLNSLASSKFTRIPPLEGPEAHIPSPASPIVSTSNLIKVTKTNDSNGRVLMPGDTVNFTIKIENGNWAKMHDAVLYDKLISPGGFTITSDKYDLGELIPQEEIILEYTIQITDTGEEGMYINMAYIEAKDNLLQFGVSQTAISTFKVGNLKQNAPVQPDEDDNQLPLVLGVVSNVLPPSLKNNFVAAITKPKEQNKEPALRAGVEPNVTKALASSGSENFTATNPLRNQLIATFGMVSIAALAYAVLNQVQRRRSQF